MSQSSGIKFSDLFLATSKRHGVIRSCLTNTPFACNKFTVLSSLPVSNTYILYQDNAYYDHLMDLL